MGNFLSSIASALLHASGVKIAYNNLKAATSLGILRKLAGTPFYADVGRQGLIMYTRVLVITSLSSLLTPTTLAQQSCYWPDGSSPPASDGYVDCYLNQDSQCCLSRDACLSNGLCYGSTYGWVRPVHSFSLIQDTFTDALALVSVG